MAAGLRYPCPLGISSSHQPIIRQRDGKGARCAHAAQRLFLWLKTWKSIRLVVVRSLTLLSLSHRSVTRRQDRSADMICEGGGICPLFVAVRVQWPDGGSTTNASWVAWPL